MSASLECCSQLFIDRITCPSRGGRRVYLLGCPPGLTNRNWFDGAYNTTLPQGIEKGTVVSLTPTAKDALFQRCSKYPLVHANQEEFDKWLESEINEIGELVAQKCPAVLWTVGRSQKLINILLKYCCAAYHSGIQHFYDFKKEVPDIARLTIFLHAPVDRATIKHVAQTAKKDGFGSSQKLLSWWKDMTLAQYRAAQEEIARLATAKSISRIHYEMLYIW